MRRQELEASSLITVRKQKSEFVLLLVSFSISAGQDHSQRMVPPTVGGFSHLNIISKISLTGLLRVLSLVDPRLSGLLLLALHPSVSVE